MPHTTPSREDDENELALLSALQPVIRHLAEANVIANISLIHCPQCFLEILFGSLHATYAIHHRDQCQTEEEFIERAGRVFTNTLKDLLANGAPSDNKTTHPSATHLGTETPQ